MDEKPAQPADNPPSGADKNYSTFDQEESSSNPEPRPGLMKLKVALDPRMFEPPLGVDMMKKISPTAITYDKVKYFTLVYLALLYLVYHMSRLPFSIAKTVLHKANCSGLSIASELVGYKSDCGWAPFDKPNYAFLFGLMDYAFTFTYSLSLMFISGPLAERIRPRTFLFLGTFLSGVSTAMFGLGYHFQIHSIWYYLFCMILLGVFQSTGLPTIVAILTEWTTEENRGKTLGLWSICMFAGNILGALIPGGLVSADWSTSFYVPGLIMMVLAFFNPVLIVAAPSEAGYTRQGKPKMVRSSKPTNPSSADSSGDQTTGTESAPLVATDEDGDNREAVTITEAIKISGVLEFAFCLFFAKLVSYTALYWLPKMMNIKGFSPTHSSYLTAVFDAGGMCGALFAGLISDKLGYAALIVTTGLASGIPFLMGLNYLGSYSDVFYYVVLLLISGILVNGPYAYIVSVVSSKKGEDENVTKKGQKGTATVSGIIDGIGSVGGAVGPLIAGYVAGYSYAYIIYLFLVSLILGILVMSRLVIHDVQRLHKNLKSQKEPE